MWQLLSLLLAGGELDNDPLFPLKGERRALVVVEVEETGWKKCFHLVSVMYLHEKWRKQAAQGMLFVDVDISDLDHSG